MYFWVTLFRTEISHIYIFKRIGISIIIRGENLKKLIGTIFIALLIVAAVFISGCAAPEEETEANVTEITFGYQPSTHQIAYMTAKEKGFWADNLAPFGIEEINENQFPTGAPEMQAMLSGHIDVAYVGAAPFVKARSEGLDAKIVAAVQTQGSDLVLRPDIEYESPEDLKGLKLATFPPGTIQDTLLRDWLKDNGVDPEEDVSIAPMGPGDAITAISAGQIDGVFLPHPAPSIIEAEGNGRTVVSSGQMQDEHACCVLVVSGDLIENNPELVQEIVNTHVEATEYNQQNTDEAAEIFADKIGWEVELVQESVAEWDGEWVSDPNQILNSTVDYAQVQHDLGYIETPLTSEDLFDLSFFETLNMSATEE